jgi:hypothetical protein
MSMRYASRMCSVIAFSRGSSTVISLERTAASELVTKAAGPLLYDRHCTVPKGCAPQKPRTTSGDTLFQLVFMMQTAQDVLNCDPTIARQSMSRGAAAKGVASAQEFLDLGSNGGVLIIMSYP